MLEDLATSIRERQAILFVGAGVSTGVGAPTWNGLIEEIGAKLGYDRDVFRSLGANNLAVAEYYKIKMGGIGSLRSWMDNKWQLDDSELEKSAIHKLIAELLFPLIYTTNYDRHIENGLRIHGIKCQKISNIRHLTGECDGTQVIKLHGDFDDDNSIVMTESNYFDRLSFETPLDIKLRSDALGKSILFIGYSLTDINVRLLLYKMWKLWGESGYADERPKSYLFLSRPDEIQQTILEQWGVHTIIGDTDDPGTSLCAFLQALKEKVFSP